MKAGKHSLMSNVLWGLALVAGGAYFLVNAYRMNDERHHLLPKEPPWKGDPIAKGLNTYIVGGSAERARIIFAAAGTFSELGSLLFFIH